MRQVLPFRSQSPGARLAAGAAVLLFAIALSSTEAAAQPAPQPVDGAATETDIAIVLVRQRGRRAWREVDDRLVGELINAGFSVVQGAGGPRDTAAGSVQVRVNRRRTRVTIVVTELPDGVVHRQQLDLSDVEAADAAGFVALRAVEAVREVFVEAPEVEREAESTVATPVAPPTVKEPPPQQPATETAPPPAPPTPRSLSIASDAGLATAEGFDQARGAVSARLGLDVTEQWRVVLVGTRLLGEWGFENNVGDARVRLSSGQLGVAWRGFAAGRLEGALLGAAGLAWIEGTGKERGSSPFEGGSATQLVGLLTGDAIVRIHVASGLFIAVRTGVDLAIPGVNIVIDREAGAVARPTLRAMAGVEYRVRSPF